jgi:hypothetical protein
LIKAKAIAIHNFWNWCGVIWSKMNLGPTGQYHSLPRSCTIINASANFEMEVVFCERVQHRLRFCLDHLICVKMAVFQFYLQSGKHRKVGWGTTVLLFWSKKFPGEKEVRDGELS